MLTKLITWITLILLLCSPTYAVTLTFDEIPSGWALRGSEYAYSHRIGCSEDFRVTDHVGSSWGLPRSGNVLVSLGKPSPNTNPFILFGYYTDIADPDPALSVSAYFSTKTDAMVRMTAYGQDSIVASMVIGAQGESWNNEPIGISTTPDLPIYGLVFEGVNSDDDLLGFCLDDMTITLVPEPSSLLVLGGGVGALGLLCRRRTSNIER